ncbi:RNase H domain-containing protein [Trichonephila clavipes]|nr:RNase H domain-containing protein [Trichonephila clavipes]
MRDETILTKKNYGHLWILFDTLSSFQHLNNWLFVKGETSLSILNKLKFIALHHDIHFQWMPSQVNLYGNEMVDKPAKEGYNPFQPSSLPPFSFEMILIKKPQNLLEWRVPLTHHWYVGNRLSLAFTRKCDIGSQTTHSRLASGPIRCLSFS